MVISLNQWRIHNLRGNANIASYKSEEDLIGILQHSQSYTKMTEIHTFENLRTPKENIIEVYFHTFSM